MKVAVAIPCYKVKSHILSVIEGIGAEVDTIYVVDDCCPEQSGNFVIENNQDERVKVLWHSENQGVGGAIVTAYQKALEDDMDIVVKVDVMDRWTHLCCLTSLNLSFKAVLITRKALDSLLLNLLRLCHLFVNLVTLHSPLSIKSLVVTGTSWIQQMDIPLFTPKHCA